MRGWGRSRTVREDPAWVTFVFSLREKRRLGLGCSVASIEDRNPRPSTRIGANNPSNLAQEACGFGLVLSQVSEARPGAPMVWLIDEAKTKAGRSPIV